VAVGTPPGINGAADESQLIEVAAGIGRVATVDSVIVVKSTVPIGASGRMLVEIQRNLLARGSRVSAQIVVSPEFLRAGSAFSDFNSPDRVVIGGSDGEALSLVRDLYLEFVPADRILVMDEPSAILVKYAANAMLATRISFMNEIAALAEATGARIDAIQVGMGRDPRIGPDHLGAGIGFGGSCLPKDLAALQAMGLSHGIPMRIAHATDQVNLGQPHKVVEKLHALLGSLSGSVVAVWGSSFKEGTDDRREAPAARVIADLVAAGSTIRVYDPTLSSLPTSWTAFEAAVVLTSSAAEAASGADAIVVATAEREFRDASLENIASTMRRKIIVDGRNVMDPDRVRSLGFTYLGFGRP
jgi:UDPglucose 6-dehydrogenase